MTLSSLQNKKLGKKNKTTTQCLVFMRKLDQKEQEQVGEDLGNSQLSW